MIAEDLLIGLRIGGVALFTWLAWRVLFESWHITEQSEPVRHNAWLYWRTALLVLCFVMVFLASPENVLRAAGYIGERTSFWMMSATTAGAMIYATLIHHGLDLANGRRPTTWKACVLITAVSAFYGAGRHLL